MKFSYCPDRDNESCSPIGLKKVIQKLYNKVYRYRDRNKQLNVPLHMGVVNP